MWNFLEKKVRTLALGGKIERFYAGLIGSVLVL